MARIRAPHWAALSVTLAMIVFARALAPALPVGEAADTAE